MLIPCQQLAPRAPGLFMRRVTLIAESHHIEELSAARIDHYHDHAVHAELAVEALAVFIV